MAEDAGGPWEALRRAYAPAPSPARSRRAAIIEYDGGLARANAEALAFKAHGLSKGLA